MQTKIYILIYFYLNIKILKNIILKKKICYFKQIFKYLKIFVFLKNLKNFCTTKKDFVFFIKFKKKQFKKKIIKIFI